MIVTSLQDNKSDLWLAPYFPIDPESQPIWANKPCKMRFLPFTIVSAVRQFNEPTCHATLHCMLDSSGIMNYAD